MKKEFGVSFMKDGVPQARIVRATDADMAGRFFCWEEPNAKLYGVSEHFGMIKPGMPVDEVPDDFNGILLDDVWDNKEWNERTLFFDVPLSYLGPEYFHDLDDIPVSACITIRFNPDYPVFAEACFEVSPTNEDGEDFDWYAYDMTSDEFAMFMGIAKQSFRHLIQVGVKHLVFGDFVETEVQFYLDDHDGEYDITELFNCIFDEIKTYCYPTVIYIEEPIR